MNSCKIYLYLRQYKKGNILTLHYPIKPLIVSDLANLLGFNNRTFVAEFLVTDYL